MKTFSKEFSTHSSDSEYEENISDEELQEAFERGDLKPGLNIQFEAQKQKVNNITKILAKTDEIKLNLPWVERMDLISDMAPLAPEFVVQIEQHEQKRANLFKGNLKIPYVRPEADPVLNDFKREMCFHRQAQAAVLEGVKRLRDLGIHTKRPDDYFAEMAKSDQHMQKVRSNLIAKQEGRAKSERIRQIREQRKMGKMLAKQTKVQREMEKKDLLDKLKKFRKGKLKNLDFLEDAKSLEAKQKKSVANRKIRDKRFGFGGKKKGMKSNTKASSAGVEKVQNPNKVTSRRVNSKKGNANKRLGKSRRLKAKRSKK